VSDIVTAADAARAALDAAAGGAAVAIVTSYATGQPVRRMIVREHGATTGTLGSAALDAAALRCAQDLLTRGGADPVLDTVEIDGTAHELFVEVVRAPEPLVIVGAGHIAVPLAHVGVMLGFRVTVLDDREDMATPERFDDAVRVVRNDFATDPFAGVRIGSDSYVALVTRGHRWDFDCLHRIIALDARPRYIGMIGSRRRVRAAFLALLESGVPRDVLATVRAPIGLELQAETPAEIAIAIGAELVAVRHGADIASISARERVLDRMLK
jgi:xanthine dehydrogenase accessory factor